VLLATIKWTEAVVGSLRDVDVSTSLFLFPTQAHFTVLVGNKHHAILEGKRSDLPFFITVGRSLLAFLDRADKTLRLRTHGKLTNENNLKTYHYRFRRFAPHQVGIGPKDGLVSRWVDQVGHGNPSLKDLEEKVRDLLCCRSLVVGGKWMWTALVTVLGAVVNDEVAKSLWDKV